VRVRITLSEAMARYIPLFPASFETAAGRFRPRPYAKGECFLRSGSSEPKMGFVEEGLFRFYYVGEDGNEATRAFILEGGFLASRPAIMDGRPTPFAIEALEDSIVQLYTGTMAELAELGGAGWTRFLLALTQERLEAKDRRIEGFITKDAAGRYLDFLDEFPGIEERVRQHHIASYLGVTPVTLSRIRARLLREGRLPGLS
jgi:CRP-like cAMP-binding protein